MVVATLASMNHDQEVVQRKEGARDSRWCPRDALNRAVPLHIGLGRRFQRFVLKSDAALRQFHRSPDMWDTVVQPRSDEFELFFSGEAQDGSLPPTRCTSKRDMMNTGILVPWVKAVRPRSAKVFQSDREQRQRGHAHFLKPIGIGEFTLKQNRPARFKRFRSAGDQHVVQRGAVRSVASSVLQNGISVKGLCISRTGRFKGEGNDSFRGIKNGMGGERERRIVGGIGPKAGGGAVHASWSTPCVHQLASVRVGGLKQA
jgi:hypothetical protein